MAILSRNGCRSAPKKADPSEAAGKLPAAVIRLQSYDGFDWMVPKPGSVSATLGAITASYNLQVQLNVSHTWMLKQVMVTSAEFAEERW